MDWIEISMGLNISIPTVERVYEKKRKKGKYNFAFACL